MSEESAHKSLVEQEWEKNPRAMYEAHRDIWRETVANLTAQLEAAEATIAEALSEAKSAHVYNTHDCGPVVVEEVRDEIVDILSRARTAEEDDIATTEGREGKLMEQTEQGTPAMIALADQVQQMCVDSGITVAAFIIIAMDGNVESRSRISDKDFKRALVETAETF